MDDQEAFNTVAAHLAANGYSAKPHGRLRRSGQWEAYLLKDGQKVGFAVDDGRGGALRCSGESASAPVAVGFHEDRAAWEAFRATVEASGAAMTFQDMSIPIDRDLAFAILVEQAAGGA